MRRFYLERTRDISGVSGTGRVVEGVLFSNGQVVMQWLSDHSSLVIHESFENVIEVHGHGGTTTVRWIDAEEGV